jgi:hypothetical protein
VDWLVERNVSQKRAISFFRVEVTSPHGDLFQKNIIRNEPDETDENYDMSWKTRTVFDKLNTKQRQTVWDKHLLVSLF